MTVTLRTLAHLAVFVSLPGATWADITAKDVWDNLVAYHGLSGGKVTGTLERSGDTLRITDIIIETPNGGREMIPQTLGNLDLVELEDGRVQIVYPPVQEFEWTSTTPTATNTISVSVSREGFEMFASGAPGTVSYHATAAVIESDLRHIMTEEYPASAPTGGGLGFRAEGVSSITLMDVTGGLSVSNTTSFGRLAARISLKSPENTLTYEIDSIDAAVGYKMATPLTAFELLDMNAGFRQGHSFTASFGAATSTVEASFTEPGSAPVSLAMDTSQGHGRVVMDQTGVHLSVGSDTASLNLSNLPLFGMRAQGYHIDMSVPFLAAETVQDVQIRLGVSALTMPDAAWASFDPGGALLRDPASFDLDVTLDIMVSEDVFDPTDPSTSPEGTMEILGARVNGLSLDAAGIGFHATGAGTFDPDRLDPTTGMPATDGRAQMSLTGAHALIDRLIEMGLLGPQDALSARATLGVIFEPAGGPDDLISDVTVDGETGGIVINGIKIR